MTLLAIVPTEAELDAVAAALTDQGLSCHDIEIGRLAATQWDNGLITVRGGLGKAQFGVQTQHLIDHVDGLSLVVCAGSAGGLVEDLAVGDVVIGTETVEHDFKWTFIERELPRFEGHQPTISDLKNSSALQNTSFQVRFAAIASGDEGIADSQRAEQITQATGAVAVAWEGAGGARACAFSGVPFLEIRGISDSADHNARSDFFANIPVALANVSEVLAQLSQLTA